MRNCKISPLMLLVLLLPVCLTVLAAASEVDAGFTVSAVIPENQIDKDARYFDLWMEPGQIQDLWVQVDNPNDGEITVSVETVTASTNRSGLIHYSSPGLYDESMDHHFAALTEIGESTVVIPPHRSVSIPVTVTMPEQSYDGLILGAIRVIRHPDGQDPVSAAGVVNQYSYAIGVRLRETDVEVAPEFALGEVFTELVNHKAAIVAPIRNTRAAIARDVSVTARIYGEGQDVPIIEKSHPQVDLAPNAVFPLSLIDQEGYGFSPGGYTAVVELWYGGESQTFEDSFEISRETAAQLTQSAVNQVQNRTEAASSFPVLAVAAGAVIGLAAVAGGSLFLRKRHRR